MTTCFLVVDFPNIPSDLKSGYQYYIFSLRIVRTGVQTVGRKIIFLAVQGGHLEESAMGWRWQGDAGREDDHGDSEDGNNYGNDDSNLKGQAEW